MKFHGLDGLKSSFARLVARRIEQTIATNSIANAIRTPRSTIPFIA
jgi:hypothetical protein